MAHHLQIESLEEMEQAGALGSKETTLLLLINTHDKLLKTHTENSKLKKELGEEKSKNEHLMLYFEQMEKEQAESKAELKKQITQSNELRAENQEIKRRLNANDEKIQELCRLVQGKQNSTSEPLYTVIYTSSGGGLEHRRRSGSASSTCSNISSEISSECRTVECDTDTYEQRGTPPPKLPERLQGQYKAIPASGDVISSSDEDVSGKKKSFLAKTATEIKSLFRLKK